MKKPTVKGLKKKLLNTIKREVRREAKGVCYTCGKKVGYEKLQGGHFIHEAKTSVIAFDKRLIKAQCLDCNYWKSGNLQIYTIKMIDEYGLEQVKE